MAQQQRHNPFDLSGKVALVTGANAGLGFGYARALASAGADVVIWGRRADRNEQALEQLKAYGTRVRSRVVDVAHEAEIVAGMQAAVDEFGRLDCVVANAGIATMSPVVEMSAATWRGLLDINLDGAFFTIREAARHMSRRAQAGEHGGSIIVCGSLSAFGGVPGMAHYSAAKSALLGVVKTLALELGPLQIRANMIAPGFMVSEMTQADPEVFKMLDAKVSATVPLGRTGVADDLDGAVIYLASDAAKYHTGDVLTVDGGRMAGVM